MRCCSQFRISIAAILISFFMVNSAFPQGTKIVRGQITVQTYKPYPHVYADKPQVPSPFTMTDGVEVVVAFTKNSKYATVPVTFEDAPLNLRYGPKGIGKGKQLKVDADDFPTLARTGLHSEEELDAAETITGRPAAEITKIRRPKMSSGEGFMAGDEDILSVLKGDNRLVRRLGLKHPEMARPLFHVWNLILKEYELGNMGRLWDNFKYVLYNGVRIGFGEVHPTRGFQESIFDDEIEGAFQTNFHRELDQIERDFLSSKYSRLNKEQMEELTKKLSHVLTGEMEPYYVMRYGFYEGRTGYRADPIAIAWIFGLKSLEQIEAAFEGQLYEALTQHFTRETVSRR